MAKEEQPDDDVTVIVPSPDEFERIHGYPIEEEPEEPDEDDDDADES